MNSRAISNTIFWDKGSYQRDETFLIFRCHLHLRVKVDIDYNEILAFIRLSKKQFTKAEISFSFSRDFARSFSYKIFFRRYYNTMNMRSIIYYRKGTVDLVLGIMAVIYLGKPCHTTRSFAPTRLFSEISLTHEDENGPYLEATVTILGKQRKAIDFGTKKTP
jgi:hypothetical protein